MKKLLSLIMVITLVSNVAVASPAETSVNHIPMIAKTFDDFRYKMTVDANSDNAEYQTKAVEDFKQRMADLQAQGVDPMEVMNYMRSTMLDASSRADFDLMMNSMDPSQISGEDAGNLAMEFMAKKYQDGANYSGGAGGNYSWVAVVLGVVIVGVVVFFVVRNHIRTQTNTTTTTNTKTNTVTNTQTDTQTNTITTTTTATITNTTTVTNTSTGCSWDYSSSRYNCGYAG